MAAPPLTRPVTCAYAVIKAAKASHAFAACNHGVYLLCSRYEKGCNHAELSTPLLSGPSNKMRFERTFPFYFFRRLACKAEVSREIAFLRKNGENLLFKP